MATPVNKIIDRAAKWKVLKRRAEEMGQEVPEIDIGVFGDLRGANRPKIQRTGPSARKGDIRAIRATWAEIAVAHEFGTKHVPERSFIRSTADERAETVCRLEAQALDRALFKGSSFRQERRRIALVFRRWIWRKMKALYPLTTEGKKPLPNMKWAIQVRERASEVE